MVSGKPHCRVASEACAYTAQAVGVDVWLLGDVIDCCKQVAHAVAAVVGTDLPVPRVSETREAATVGSDDNISVGCHNLEVPAVAPELAHRRLGTTLAEEQGGVLLRRVEVWRVDDP